MRSDVKHLAKCGKESLYYCRLSGKEFCTKFWPKCIYKPKTNDADLCGRLAKGDPDSI